MNIHDYCRKSNKTEYPELIASLQGKEIIFIGESRHSDHEQENNEKIIISELTRQNKISIAIEDIFDEIYDSKRDMLLRFSHDGLFYLPKETRQTVSMQSRQMAEVLPAIMENGKITVVIVGSDHLVGTFTNDLGFLLRHFSSATIFLEEEFLGKDNLPVSGIYRRNTPATRDHIIVGNLESYMR